MALKIYAASTTAVILEAVKQAQICASTLATQQMSHSGAHNSLTMKFLILHCLIIVSVNLQPHFERPVAYPPTN